MKRHIVVAISARASYSRIKSALLELKKRNKVKLTILLFASASIKGYGDVARQMKYDGLCPEVILNSLDNGATSLAAINTTAKSLELIGGFLAKIKPDAVVTIADRYETIATAIAASYQNIPLIHIQGGEVTGNIDEKVRHAVTKLADVHLVSTKRAKEYLIRMGECPDRVTVTGCPSCDLARYIMENPNDIHHTFRKYFDEKTTGILMNHEFVVVLYHATTLHNDDTEVVDNILKSIKKLGLYTLWLDPNRDPGADKVINETSRYLHEKENDAIIQISFLGNMDFLRIVRYSKGLVGNSSAGIRECSFMGIPALNIGDRQKMRERGSNVIDVSEKEEDIYEGLVRLMDYKCRAEKIYGDGYAGERIALEIERCTLTFEKSLSYADEG